MGFDQSFATAVRGRYPGVALYSKKCREMKRKQAAGEYCLGFTNKQSPQSGAFSGDLPDQKCLRRVFTIKSGLKTRSLGLTCNMLDTD